MVYMDKCTGCKACVVACSLAKEKVFSLTKSRIRVVKVESECVAIPIVCEQCEEPHCRDACPVEAINRDPETGIIKVNWNVCDGCGACKGTCPYDAVIIDPERNMVMICDLCQGDPECAKVCSLGGIGAIEYVKADRSMILKKKKLAEERVKAILSLGTWRAV